MNHLKIVKIGLGLSSNSKTDLFLSPIRKLSKLPAEQRTPPGEAMKGLRAAGLASINPRSKGRATYRRGMDLGCFVVWLK